MVLNFTKMNGAGNDFILLDNRNGNIDLAPDAIVRLCDRHRGIGADGLILLVPCKTGEADWAWDFYNSDGSSGEMCGNGSRCFARFVQKLTGIKERFTFKTVAGIITARLKNQVVTVDLTEPKDLRMDQRVPLASGTLTLHSVNTGVPHAVLFVPNVDEVPVATMGAEIRRHPHFGPKGTNVNFVEVTGANQIRVRTFERGVEGETLACGTGVSASALISAKLHGFRSPVGVRVRGGSELQVSFEERAGSFANVRLTGPAEFVFEGSISI